MKGKRKGKCGSVGAGAREGEILNHEGGRIGNWKG